MIPPTILVPGILDPNIVSLLLSTPFILVPGPSYTPEILILSNFPLEIVPGLNLIFRIHLQA